MKVCIASFALFCILLPARAMAGSIIYENGPVNGNTDAWLINFGFAVTNSFTLTGETLALEEVRFWVWLIPGDTMTRVEALITTEPFSGNFFDKVLDVTQSGCFTNNFGIPVCQETALLNVGGLHAGQYWLQLQNAVIPNGDPVYWDENSGKGCMSQGCPSVAYATGVGTIASEAFTITGIPEPSGLLVMFGGGFSPWRACGSGS